MKMSTISTNPKPTEVKREEFRKYLEHSGVMDSLTQMLLSLYEEHERPDDAMEYIRKHFGALDISRTETPSEAEILKKELADAKAEIAELKERLSKYESENAA